VADHTTRRSVSGTNLPADAVRRLEDLGPSKGGTRFFTSDLSVSEFLLLREAGFRPRGLVMGSSIFHIGLQARWWRKNEELKKLSQAMYSAREAAMERLEEEAEMLGADGVVGVRLDMNFYEWGKHSAEFIAIGTAVSADDAAADWRPASGKPFTSDLLGQDFWTLLQSGYAPLGLVMGTCVYHVGHRGVVPTAAGVSRNVELNRYSQAIYDAREPAMQRMQAEGIALGAEGVVGVQLVEKSHFWGSHVMEFFAVGTAVRPLGKSSATDNGAPLQPTLFVSLDN
jgi:uncharacterized protein YbjQ (UPF0145 family)